MLAIVGSKGYKHQDWVESFLEGMPSGTQLITTPAHGPSTWAFEYCKLNPTFPNPKIVAIPRGEHSKEEFIKYVLDQQTRILNNCQMLVVFWSDDDIACKELIRVAAQNGKLIYIFPDNMEESRFMLHAHYALSMLGLLLNAAEAVNS